MLVLYHPDCLFHRTVELLGGKVIPALESPERLESIVKALKEDGTHELRIEPFSPWSIDDDLGHTEEDLIKWILKDTHEAGYLKHLQTVHRRWVADGLIDDTEHVLPECFRVPSKAGGIPKSTKPPFASPPPKDIYAQSGYYTFDMSTGIAKDTWTSVLASANLAARAASYISSNTTAPGDPQRAHKDVLALCRPPGHHCTTAMAGGYCYVNNAVVSIEALARLQRATHARTQRSTSAEAERSAEGASPRVAILDLDFHHGNGTQDVYYADTAVLYVSIHGADEYPYYTGFESECGEGPGRGYTLNLPLRTDASFDEYKEKLGVAVAKLVEFAPDFLLVSLGFDTFRLDPIGKFDIDIPDYETMARTVRATPPLRDVPSIILLEGGYTVDKLGECMLSFLKGWESGGKGL